MFNIFDFYRFEPLMEALKKIYKQADLAKSLKMSAQMINQIFNDKQHLVFDDVRKWRGALKLKREDGDYFEMLALICAYPHQTKNKRDTMLQRAFHLVGRLEEEIGPENVAANTLLYRLDPVATALRNLTELKDFPLDEQVIPNWASDKITFIRILGSLRKNIPPRIESTWKWLRSLNLVYFSEERGRWLKGDDKIFTNSPLAKEVADIHSSVFLLCRVNTLQDFIHEAETDRILGDKLGTISLPSKALALLDRLQEDFFNGEIAGKLPYVCNKSAMERLKSDDPDFYKEVAAYKKALEHKGYEIPDATDADVDVTVELLLTARRLTQFE